MLTFCVFCTQVGYTNAGKSTLLNRLSGAGVLAEDRLFATLDPTTRRVEVWLRAAPFLLDGYRGCMHYGFSSFFVFDFCLTFK